MVLDFFSDQWGVLASQTNWINSRSSVAPRSSGCSRTVVAWHCALLSCQNREVQVFGWSDGQMESFTAYSKHLVWLTRRTTHLFSLSPIPQPIASILVLSHHLNPAPKLFFKRTFYCSLAAASSLFLSSQPWPMCPGGEAQGWFAAKADMRQIGGHVNRTLKIHRRRDYL